MPGDLNNIFDQPSDYSVEEISLEEFLSVIHKTKEDDADLNYVNKIKEKLDITTTQKVA